MDAFWRMTTEHTIFRVDYRASLRVACRYGRFASGLESRRGENHAINISSLLPLQK